VALVKVAMVDQPALRPLALFLKFFLYCRGLHETYSGGVGSYMLLIMVLSFLQLHPICTHVVGKSHPKDHVNLGALLIGQCCNNTIHQSHHHLLYPSFPTPSICC
jgi:non-canonical poly(A) RNA polymerase PAPD5/7